jgi:hypothetical protein
MCDRTTLFNKQQNKYTKNSPYKSIQKCYKKFTRFYHIKCGLNLNKVTLFNKQQHISVQKCYKKYAKVYQIKCGLKKATLFK